MKKISNDLLFQWGNIPKNTSTTTVSFCISMETCLFINVGIMDNTTRTISVEAWHSPSVITQTTFQIYSNSDYPNNVRRKYIAIGV